MNLVELDRALRQLRLSGMAAVLDTRLRQAQAEKMVPIDLVSVLVADELRRRQDRLLERRHKLARFRDPERALDTFDFDFNKKMNRALVYELATARFIAQREDVLFLGPPGTRRAPSTRRAGDCRSPRPGGLEARRSRRARGMRVAHKHLGHLDGYFRASLEIRGARVVIEQALRPNGRSNTEPDSKMLACGEPPFTSDAYLPLKMLAAYSGLSVRTLRVYLADPLGSLPHYRIGGKILVRRFEFDGWARRFRRAGSGNLDSMVDELLKGIA